MKKFPLSLKKLAFVLSSSLPVKQLAGNYFIRIIRSNQFPAKKTFHETVCWSLVRLLHICLDAYRKINHIMKDRYTLSMKITVGLSMIYLEWISLSVFTIEISIELLDQQSLAIELFKVKENLSNTIMSDIFPPGYLTLFKIASRFFHKYYQYYKIWFKLIKIIWFVSLEHDTYRN